MSVQSWKRKLSKTEFLHQIFELNIVVGHIIGGTPKKYLNNYGDVLVASASGALRHAQAANSTFVAEGDETAYHFRENELRKAAGCLENVSTMAYIFLEIVRRHDGLSAEKRTKIRRQEELVGNYVENAIRLIGGVMRSDKSRFLKDGNASHEADSPAGAR